MWVELSRVERANGKAARVGIVPSEITEVRQGDEVFPVVTLKDGRQLADLPRETALGLQYPVVTLTPAEHAEVLKLQLDAAQKAAAPKTEQK